MSSPPRWKTRNQPAKIQICVVFQFHVNFVSIAQFGLLYLCKFRDSTMTAFEEMGVLPELGRAVEEMDWTLPTDVQAEAIPVILGGGDVLMVGLLIN